jgi:hypothetical protein
VYIQYSGFDVGPDSRTYSFDVIEAEESRHLTVEIRAEAFQPPRLQFQDGPDICFACLKKGLEAERPEDGPLTYLRVGDEDVEAYLYAHRPVKAPGRRGPFAVKTAAEHD